MEIICRVEEQGALVENEFTAKDGSKKKKETMRFKLKCGSDSFYADMVFENARNQGVVDKSCLYKATIYLEGVSGESEDHRSWSTTRITLIRLCVL